MHIFQYITPYASSTILGYPIKDLNYMQNNQNRSDFADAHPDFSTDAVMPLKYLITKKYCRAHTNFFAQFQSAMFSQFRLQLSPLAKSVGRGRRDAQLNFH